MTTAETTGDLPFSLMDNHDNLLSDYPRIADALCDVVTLLDHGQREGAGALRIVEFTDDGTMHVLLAGDDRIRAAEEMRKPVGGRR